MKLDDFRDVLAGALIAGVGLFIVIRTGASYDLGTIRRMGPGMFPFGLGLLLVGLGAIIGLTGFVRAGGPMDLRPRPLAAVLGSIACFAVLIGPFGLVPAIIGVVAVSPLAERRPAPVSVLVLCAALSMLAVVIFSVGLRLPIDLVDWPF